MPDDFEEDYEMTAWISTVEVRLGRLKLVGMVDGAVAITALGVGIFLAKGMANLATTLGQMAQLTNGLAQVVMPPPNQTAPVADVWQGKPKGSVIDETPVPDSQVAEPAVGPETEASETAKALMAEDDVPPAALHKQPIMMPSADVAAIPPDDLPYAAG
jgi:hypothetical protein